MSWPDSLEVPWTNNSWNSKVKATFRATPQAQWNIAKFTRHEHTLLKIVNSKTKKSVFTVRKRSRRVKWLIALINAKLHNVIHVTVLVTSHENVISDSWNSWIQNPKTDHKQRKWLTLTTNRNNDWGSKIRMTMCDCTFVQTIRLSSFCTQNWQQYEYWSTLGYYLLAKVEAGTNLEKFGEKGLQLSPVDRQWYILCLLLGRAEWLEAPTPWLHDTHASRSDQTASGSDISKRQAQMAQLIPEVDRLADAQEMSERATRLQHQDRAMAEMPAGPTGTQGGVLCKGQRPSTSQRREKSPWTEQGEGWPRKIQVQKVQLQEKKLPSSEMSLPDPSPCWGMQTTSISSWDSNLKFLLPVLHLFNLFIQDMSVHITYKAAHMPAGLRAKRTKDLENKPEEKQTKNWTPWSACWRSPGF